MILANLRLQLLNIAAHFIHTFRDIPFNLRLKYLVWRYKGGQNIPPHELKKLRVITSAESEKELIKTMRVTTALIDLLNKFGLDHNSSKFMVVVARFIQAELNDAGWHEVMQQILNSPRPRRLIYQQMVDLGDIPSNARLAEDPITFGRWLDEEFRKL